MLVGRGAPHPEHDCATFRAFAARAGRTRSGKLGLWLKHFSFRFTLYTICFQNKSSEQLTLPSNRHLLVYRCFFLPCSFNKLTI